MAGFRSDQKFAKPLVCTCPGGAACRIRRRQERRGGAPVAEILTCAGCDAR